MAVYTVHQPPLRRYEVAANPDRFAFVRDGFSLWAFLFGPLWMLWHRMWLVLLGYTAIAVALLLAFTALRASAGQWVVGDLLLALLLGMEAGTLRRFTLSRRGWVHLGTVAGADRESVEHRFFDAWVQGEPMAAAAASHPAAAGVAMHGPAPAPEVVGLFPQPGTHR